MCLDQVIQALADVTEMNAAQHAKQTHEVLEDAATNESEVERDEVENENESDEVHHTQQNNNKIKPVSR